MPLPAGTRLGPYEIVAPLGAGGMGEVYRARDTRLGREVALKVLPEAVAAHPDRLARLDREARTVAALNHPNIVTLHSLEESQGVRFLTMELVDGRTLDHERVPGGMPLARALPVAIAIGEALLEAHHKGVVHRDLKPGNVMMTRDDRIKVLDFGLAKLAESDPDFRDTRLETVPTPLSSPGQQVGTLPYMAPEQVRGQVVDARTDLFAFGVVLFELLTGRRPFPGETSADVASAILRDPPPRLASLRPDLPRDLDRIVGRCLEKDPRDRYQSSRDLCSDLRYLWREAERSGASVEGVASGPAPSPRAGAPSSGPIAGALSSIAVLPFVNRSRNPEDEYFADGLAEELISVLTRIRGLRVAARTSAFQFRDKTDDLQAIARRLHVDTLLEGSIRRSGSRVRIHVHLVKADDGFHLWSESYDRAMDDIFAMQDDIAQSVVRELRAALLGQTLGSNASGEVRAEVAEAARGRGENVEAHRLFLQGRFFVSRLAEPDVIHGIELLHQALSLEPRHASAWACLSWAETYLATSTADDLDAGIARARDAAARAVALEPRLAEGHLAMGEILLWYDFDWSRADAEFRRALELAPGNAEALRANAILAYTAGRYGEALTFCRRAVEQDPLSVPAYGWLARVHRELGELGEAEAAFRNALAISPDAATLRALLALVISDQGRQAEAAGELAREPADWARLFAQAIIHFRSGRPEDSRRALDELKSLGAVPAAYQIAMVHAARGEADAAFEWLEIAYASRDSGVAFARGHAVFRPLHDDPRWVPFMEKLGLPAPPGPTA